MIEIKIKPELDILEVYDLLNNDKYSKDFRDEVYKKLLNRCITDKDGCGFILKKEGLRDIKLNSMDDKFEIDFNYSSEERKDFLNQLNKNRTNLMEKLIEKLVDIEFDANNNIMDLKFKSEGLNKKSRVGKLFESMSRIIMLSFELKKDNVFEVMTPLMREKYKFMGFNEEDYNHIESYDNDNVYNLRKVMFESLFIYCMELDNKEGLNINIVEELELFKLFEVKKSRFNAELNKINMYFKDRECN